MKIKAAVHLLRPPNLIMTALTIYLSYIFTIRHVSLGPTSDYWGLLSTLFIVLSIMAAGNVINDIFDREIDVINKPTKVIIGKLITVRQAKILYFSLNLVALFFITISFWRSGNTTLPIVFLSAILLLYFYSARLKKLPVWGNLTISVLCATILWIIPLSLDKALVNSWSNEFIPIVIFSAFAFCTNFIREIIKDLQDLKGDQLLGGRTIASELPLHQTKYLIYTIWVIVFFGTLLCTTLLISDKQILPGLYSITILISSVYFFYKIIQMKEHSDYTKLSRGLKLFMLQGLILLAIWN